MSGGGAGDGVEVALGVGRGVGGSVGLGLGLAVGPKRSAADGLGVASSATRTTLDEGGGQRTVLEASTRPARAAVRQMR